jgi:hypothetical protein
MTKRTEMQHRVLEFKAVAMTWAAGKLFTFKQTGIDGFIKRTMLKDQKQTNEAQQIKR